ncbi:solute carrier family 35 [Holotrichia oblita]|uniref:Solute carrier family 35 n=1 Tax=Holotrichia oblita TaxID=644536 RepID=A0ACB9TYJ1_HOLOL|nr:solute carrier family 35 [Holotrichia oblita]
MFWKRKKIKYAAVNKAGDDDIDLDHPRKSVFTPSCVRSSLLTAVLLCTYFAPSIVLTFYQRWLFQTWSLCFLSSCDDIAGFVVVHLQVTQFNVAGFVLLLIASMCSGLRWTCVQLLLQKSKIGMRDPVDMIYFMQPWMFASIIPFAMWIEGDTDPGVGRVVERRSHVDRERDRPVRLPDVGIVAHVVHKIGNAQQAAAGADGFPTRVYEKDTSTGDERDEMSSKSLMEKAPASFLVSDSEAEGDQNDSMDLFNILNRHDR